MSSGPTNGIDPSTIPAAQPFEGTAHVWFEVNLDYRKEVAERRCVRIFRSDDPIWDWIAEKMPTKRGSLLAGSAKFVDGDLLPRSLKVETSLQLHHTKAREKMAFAEGREDGRLWGTEKSDKAAEEEGAAQRSQDRLALAIADAIAGRRGSEK